MAHASTSHPHFAHPHKNISALNIEPGMIVADFGAGSGAYVFAIAEVLAGSGHVYAIDVQRDLLRRIHNEAQHRHLPAVSILWGDLEQREGSKLAAHSCDRVLISNLLFQLEHKDAALIEARRILRPQGLLAIIDWRESFGGLGPIREHVFAKEEALSIATKHGFALEREFDAGAHHYGLVFRVNDAE